MKDKIVQAEEYLKLGNFLREKEEYKEAIKNFEKSIKLNPKNPQTYNNLGVVFIILGQKKLATTYFKKAISVSENFTTAYYNLSISENFWFSEPNEAAELIIIFGLNLIIIFVFILLGSILLKSQLITLISPLSIFIIFDLSLLTKARILLLMFNALTNAKLIPELAPVIIIFFFLISKFLENKF